MMRNKLLATVAMTALIGCTSFAVAQNAGPQGGAMQSQVAQQHQGNPGGAMSTPSGGGNAQSEPSTSTPQGSSPEGKGFSQEEPKKSTPQRGAQEQRGPQNQRGAQGNEPGQAGAPGTKERMGQQDRGKQDQDRGKAVPGQAQQSGTSGRAAGASVQLSQDQRTKIRGVIVGDRNVARVDHADFNIRVGVAVPRTVHVAVLPPEVVTIVPEYRGFEYVVVGDQLLIIDPNTLEIVAILPA
jgi:hypothetical protein